MSCVVISSDWHFKFSAQFDRPTDQGIPSRLQEIIDSVKWVSSVGKQHKAVAFLALGDLFDSAERLQTKEGLAISELFMQLSQTYKRKVFTIPGNHDCISSTHNILDIFSASINVFSKPSFVDIPGARLFFLPYIREPEDFYEAVNSFQSSDCIGKKYLFAHFWDSTTVSADPEAIDLSKINLDFFDRVFTGHFHGPTQDPARKVIYVGTLLNKRFNESGDKGCWILDLEKNSLKFIANPISPAFVTCSDSSLLLSEKLVESNSYYRVGCSPENVLEVTKLLGKAKGFELVTAESSTQSSISIANIEKRNSASLKEYIVANCGVFLPDGISKEDFISHGTSFLAGL